MIKLLSVDYLILRIVFLFSYSITRSLRGIDMGFYCVTKSSSFFKSSDFSDFVRLLQIMYPDSESTLHLLFEEDFLKIFSRILEIISDGIVMLDELRDNTAYFFVLISLWDFGIIFSEVKNSL